MKSFGRFYSLASGFLLAAAPAIHAQVAVQIGQNFTGSTYNLNSTALPPDPNGAIGPRHFVEFINGSFAVYNKTNSHNIKRISDLKFWSNAGVILSTDSGVSDPRIIFDPVSQRWFASQVDLDAAAADPTLEANDFLLAVSATSDPTGVWHGFLFQADPDNGYFADFPTLGLDTNGVYLSGDMFSGADSPIGPGLVSVPKADLLAVTPTIDNRTWFGVMSYDIRGQVLQPAISTDGSGTILAVTDIGNDSDPHSNLVSFVVQNAASPSASLSSPAIIGTSSYVVPFDSDQGFPLFTPLQPDGTTTLAGNDARLCARVYNVAGVLYAVHNTELNGRMAIRWYRINAANNTVNETGTIADPNLDLFFPAIAANTNGTVVIVCNGSSLTTFVSCYAYAGQTLNGVTTFGNAMLLQTGATSYHGDDELLDELLGLPVLSRWGDYNTVTLDPSDPTRFWSIQMFPSDAANPDVWSTQITELLTIAPPQLAIVRTGANVTVSWPGSAAAYQLQSIPSLTPPAIWSNVTQTRLTNGNRLYVALPIAGDRQFFRLQK